MSRLFDLYGTRVKEGDYIFREGDKATVLYMIHTGRVKICRTVSKGEEFLHLLEDGEFLGEMAMIDSMPRSADAVALTDCELIAMDKVSFDDALRTNPQFAVNFIQFLSKRIRNTNDILKNTTEQQIQDKFFIEVLKEFIRNGKKDSTGKYMLIDLNVFLEKFKKIHRGNEDKFWTVLEVLLIEKKIKMLKGQNKQKWLGITL